MSATQKKFWRGFTWKRFSRNALFFFTISLAFYIVLNYFDKTETIASLFTLNALAKRIITAIGWGFITAFWHEPGVDDEKQVPPVIL